MKYFQGSYLCFIRQIYFPNYHPFLQLQTKKKTPVLHDTCNRVLWQFGLANTYVALPVNALFMTFLHWSTKDVKRSNSIFASKRGLQVLNNSLFQWCIGLYFCIWKYNIWFYCLYSIPTIFINSRAWDKYLWKLVIAKDEQQSEFLYFTICREFSIDADIIMLQ